jgi:uncharacterized protein (TIGR02246 family)
MEQWELVARESIRDLVARYNANGDSGRFDQVVELFAPDAVMVVDGEAFEGRDQIRTIFTGAAASLRDHGQGPVMLRHCTSTLQIDVQGPDHATSRCYYHVLMAHGLDHWGRYLDEYRVVDGSWHFARRREVLDGAVPGGWAESATPPSPPA